MHASSIGSRHRDGVICVVPERDGIVAVCLEGEFDLRNAPVLGDQLDLALESGNGVIFDLSEATFIDSSVIHVLVQTSKAASARKQPVVLQLGTAAIVERVLEIAEIEQVLTRAHDRQEAVQIIKEKAEAV